MGGGGPGNQTAELVMADTDTAPRKTFQLSYPSTYIKCFRTYLYLQNTIIFFTSAACSIHLEHTVVITGGMPSNDDRTPTARVQQYYAQGAINRLPDMLTARKDHGCGYFVNKDDKIVSRYINSNWIVYKISLGHLNGKIFRCTL